MAMIPVQNLDGVADSQLLQTPMDGQITVYRGRYDSNILLCSQFKRTRQKLDVQ